MFNNLIDMPWYSQVDRGTYWLYNIILLSLLITTQVKCSRVLSVKIIVNRRNLHELTLLRI